MDFNYDAFKQTFVDYFTKKGYRTLVSNRDKNLIFMYSIKEDISVIELWNNEEQAVGNEMELNHLVKKIAKVKDQTSQDIKCLMLFYDEQVPPYTKLKNNTFTIVANSMDYFKNKLKPEFGDIVDIVPETNQAAFKKITSSKKFNKDQVDDLSDVETQEQLQQKVNQLTMSLKRSRGFGPLFYMIAFLVVPLIGAIICMIWGANGYGLEASRLFQGGTTYHLTILGGEAWRIFSWGLSTPSDNFIIAIIVILVGGWSAFNMMKLSEFNMRPLKFFLGFLAAYILTGFFSSVMFTNFAVGGVMPILGIATGMLALSTSAKKTLVAAVSKMKLIWPIVLLVIFPIFTGGGMEYASEVMGFAIGGAIAYMLNYDYKNASWNLILPIFVLVVVIFLPIIMILIPQYVPGVDNDVIYTLAMYVKKGIISPDHANNIINRIGWDNIQIDKAANGILSIPYHL